MTELEDGSACGGSGSRIAFTESVVGRALSWSWLLVLALATTGGYVREPLTGHLLLNVLIAVHIIVAVTGWLLVWRYDNAPRLKGLWCLGLWLAVAAAGLAWAPDTGVGLRYIVYMIVRLSLIVLTASLIVRQRDGRFVTALACLGMAVVVVNVGVATWEHVTRSHLHLSGTLAMAPHKQFWPTGFLTNPNDLCLLLALYLPWVTSWPRWRRSAAAEAIATTALVVVIWVAIAAQSRAMVVVLLGQLVWLASVGVRNKGVAVAGAVVVAGLLVPFVNQQWPWLEVERTETVTEAGLDPTPLATAVVSTPVFDMANDTRPHDDPPMPEDRTVGAPTTVGGPAPTATPVTRRVQSLQEAVRALGTEFTIGGRSGSERLQMLRIGGRLLLESRGLGVGAGNSAVLIRQDKHEGLIDLHSWWMELLVDYGVVGFFAFAGFYGWLSISVWRRWLSLADGLERYLAEVALVSLLTFAAGSIVPSSIAPHHYPWMLFGLALALVSAPGAPAFQPRRRRQEAPR